MDEYVETRECIRLPSTSFSVQLQSARDAIKHSVMFEELKTKLKPFCSEIDRIRCLALGSFSDNLSSRYQLALILELICYLKVDKTILCSLYDPAFNLYDKQFIEALGKDWSIDIEFPWELKANYHTFFYLPHAPLSLSEVVIKDEQPRMYLANHVIKHTNRYTKVELFKKYPHMSKLLSDLSGQVDSSPNGLCDFYKDGGFVKFASRKSRRRRNNEVLYQEAKIDYSEIGSYFNSCKILTDFNSGKYLTSGPWINSFSDLALHLIQ